LTVDLAVAWARSKEQAKPITVDFRISAVRGFAKYLHAIDPGTEIPPAGLLSVPRRRPAPHVYSPDEIQRLLEAAAGLKPPLRAATLTTMLGLLAITGMRLHLGSRQQRHVRHADHPRMPRQSGHTGLHGVDLYGVRCTLLRISRSSGRTEYFGRKLLHAVTTVARPSGPSSKPDLQSLAMLENPDESASMRHAIARSTS
jgi:hypothetical protein